MKANTDNALLVDAHKTLGEGFSFLLKFKEYYEIISILYENEVFASTTINQKNEQVIDLDYSPSTSEFLSYIFVSSLRIILPYQIFLQTCHLKEQYYLRAIEDLFSSDVDLSNDFPFDYNYIVENKRTVTSNFPVGFRIFNKDTIQLVATFWDTEIIDYLNGKDIGIQKFLVD